MSLEGAFAAVGALLILLLILLLGVVAWRLRDARARASTADARLATLLESNASGLAVWNAERRLVACNGRFREFYPSVTLKPGLEYEDLVRYTATRAVVLVPEAEMDALDRHASGKTGRAGRRNPPYPRRPHPGGAQASDRTGRDAARLYGRDEEPDRRGGGRR